MVAYPKDWKKYAVGDVSLNFDKYRVPVAENLRVRGSTPYYGANGIQDYVKGFTHDGEFVLLAEDGATDLFDYPVRHVNGKIWVNNHAHVLKGNSSYVDTKYLSYALKKVDYVSLLVGGTRAKLNAKTLKNIEVTIPSNIKEQQAIADTLSTFDEHIDNLTELIEKKKAIRDGALEDLVTGKVRLDGFDGEWEEMPISHFALINPVSVVPEEFFYVDLESVVGIKLTALRKENKSTAPSRAQRLASWGDVFFQTVRPYQKNNYLFKKNEGQYVFSTGYAQLRTENDCEFLFFLIRTNTFVDKVLDNCTGTSYPAINPVSLGKINVVVPTDIKEQQAIASILAAMDEELDNLEREKEKILQMKAGAMDDLLTGKIRLV